MSIVKGLFSVSLMRLSTFRHNDYPTFVREWRLSPKDKCLRPGCKCHVCMKRDDWGRHDSGPDEFDPLCSGNSRNYFNTRYWDHYDDGDD